MLTPTTSPRRSRAASVVVALALLLTAAAGTSAATAAPVDQLRHAGANLNGQKVDAGVVEIEAWSTTPAREVQFFVGTRQVGVDTSLEAEDGHWVASLPVDLTSTLGWTQVKAKVVINNKSFRTFWKYFTVVKPVTAPTPVFVDTTKRPGPDNTGVPAGTALVPSGSLVVTTPGAVVSGLDITGCLTVQASNVTVRNTRITCTSPSRDRAVRVTGGVTGLVIEDSEIDGTGTTDIGIEASNAVLRRIEVRGVTDGIRIGNSLLIEDSWVHGLVRRGSGHPDAIQGISAQDVVIRHNTLNPRNYTSGDLGNAAIMLGSESGTKLSRNVLVEKNFLDGGNYSLNVSGSITAEGVVVRDNRFGTDSRYGPVVTPARVPVATGNVMDVTGLPAPITAPK